MAEDGRGHSIWRCCQNRAGLDPFAALVFPAIPYSREREQLAFTNLETIRLLGFPSSRPLIETVCRDEAPAGFQRITERRLRGRLFRPCVDQAGGAGRVFCP